MRDQTGVRMLCTTDQRGKADRVYVPGPRTRSVYPVPRANYFGKIVANTEFVVKIQRSL